MKSHRLFKYIQSLTTNEQHYHNFVAHFNIEANFPILPPRVKKLWLEKGSKEAFNYLLEKHNAWNKYSREIQQGYKIVIFNKRRKLKAKEDKLNKLEKQKQIQKTLFD